MLTPVSIEKFADSVKKDNKVYNRKELIEMLGASLEAKRNGAA